MASTEAERRLVGVGDGIHLGPIVGGHLPQADDLAHDLGVVTDRLGLGVDVADIVGDALLFFLEALDAFEQTTQSTNELINREGESIADELRTTLQKANRTADTLNATLEQAQPAVQTLNERTLPAANTTLEDLQATSRSLRSLTERLEDKGATDLLSSPKLPDYEPEDSE